MGNLVEASIYFTNTTNEIKFRIPIRLTSHLNKLPCFKLISIFHQSTFINQPCSMTVSSKEEVVCNFHVHTKFSFDGYNSFRQLYKFSKRAKIDILAITDHDTIEGGLQFLKWLDKHNLTDLEVIIGEEVTCTDGTHIIGLNLKEHIPGDTPLAVVKEIKRQGGFVYFPHPSRHDGILSSEYREDCLPYADFYEAFNGKVPHESNLETISFFSAFPEVLPLAGSDAHYNSDIQKCLCIMLNDHSEGVLQSYKRNKGICIKGYPKRSPTGYFSGYYKFKRFFDPPRLIKSVGKLIFPAYKNFRERNLVYKLEKVYDNLQEQ